MKWVSVKDRLPKEDEWILIASSILKYFEMGVFLDSGNGTQTFKDPDRGYFIYPSVSHWMPLPEIPSNDDGEFDIFQKIKPSKSE